MEENAKFNLKVKEKIQSVCQDVKVFIEKDTPVEVKLHYSSHTDKEIAEKYREVINYYNILQNHLKNMEYLIYLLTEIQNEIDVNIPNNSKKTYGLTKQIDLLKMLRDTLKGMDRGMYHTLKYYEKISS